MESTIAKTPVVARIGMMAEVLTMNGAVYGPIIGMGETFCVLQIEGGDVDKYDDRIGCPIAREWDRVQLIGVVPDPAMTPGSARHPTAIYDVGQAAQDRYTHAVESSG